MGDKLKNNWKTTKEVLRSSLNPKDYANLNRATALDRLARKYQKGSTAILLGLLLVCFYWFDFMTRDFRLMCCCVFSVIVFACGIINWILYNKISNIDPLEMSVKEVINRTLVCRKIHLWYMVFGYLAAIIAVGITIFLVRADEDLTISLGMGAVIGLAFGIKGLKQYFSDYKSLCK